LRRISLVTTRRSFQRPWSDLARGFRNIKTHNVKQILVVEDELRIACIVHDYLEHAGYSVVLARNGADALVYARIRRPDLISADFAGIEPSRNNLRPNTANSPHCNDFVLCHSPQQLVTDHTPACVNDIYPMTGQ
jgi:hypothetical protein